LCYERFSVSGGVDILAFPVKKFSQNDYVASIPNTSNNEVLVNVPSAQTHDSTLRSHIEHYCRERDEVAFRALYDACKQSVLRIAIHLSGKGDGAKDLSQEIWVKLWKHLCGFRGESKVMSWVYRVAMTTYLDKKSSLVGGSESARSAILVELSVLEKMSNEEISDSVPPDGHNPQISAETSSAHALVEQALARLTHGERTVFVAKHFHDLTFKEIAQELGTHEGTAKTLHFRALKKMQTLLAAHYAELSDSPNVPIPFAAKS
jgi:RNA polymerase sigma-70 factor (ECF subfamily)